jgi:diguanylate cyclase (GGDEF)-like protein
MTLERQDGLDLSVPDASQTHFGLTATAFRGMLLHLIQAGHLGGQWLNTWGSRGFDEVDIQSRQGVLVKNLLAGQEVRIVMSHSGRTHLWNLRDQLLRGDREDFGILLNKAAWERALPTRVQWATSSEPLGVILLDLDRFKEVNDSPWGGHVKGDEVLKIAFTIIRDTVATDGQAYRYGGEEVGVLVPGFDLDRLHDLAEKIRVAIERQVQAATALPRPQTISAGATVVSKSEDPTNVIKFADTLLYKAKNGGRNRTESAVLQL